MQLQDIPTLSLEQEARTLYSLIYEVDCYGVQDMIRLNTILKELKKRGIECTETNDLLFY